MLRLFGINNIFFNWYKINIVSLIFKKLEKGYVTWYPKTKMIKFLVSNTCCLHRCIITAQERRVEHTHTRAHAIAYNLKFNTAL